MPRVISNVASTSAPIRLGVSTTPLWLSHCDLPCLGGDESAGGLAGGPPKVSHSRWTSSPTPFMRSKAAGVSIGARPANMEMSSSIAGAMGLVWPTPVDAGMREPRASPRLADASDLCLGTGVGLSPISGTFPLSSSCTLALSTYSR